MFSVEVSRVKLVDWAKYHARYVPRLKFPGTRYLGLTCSGARYSGLKLQELSVLWSIIMSCAEMPPPSPSSHGKVAVVAYSWLTSPAWLSMSPEIRSCEG
jgi:hypothetical protein